MIASGLGFVGGGGRAQARALRPLFEPTDLELEETGVVEVDVQMGGIRGQGPWRAVIPDFELDVGLLPALELDLDGAYAIEGPAAGPFSFDHPAPDSLWPSVKLGIYDHPTEGGGIAYAIGAQVGPKLPIAAGAHGIGLESLLLLGGVWHRLQLVLNLGGFVDPAPDAASARPRGLEAGLDVTQKLNDTGQLSVTAELSAVRFTSGDPAQLLATGGITWAAAPYLDLSVVGLVGLLGGSDRYGLLVGLSPKVHLFSASPPTAVP